MENHGKYIHILTRHVCPKPSDFSNVKKNHVIRFKNKFVDIKKNVVKVKRCSKYFIKSKYNIGKDAERLYETIQKLRFRFTTEKFGIYETKFSNSGFVS